MREILLATGNPDKAREMVEILSEVSAGAALPVHWRRLGEFKDLCEPQIFSHGNFLNQPDDLPLFVLA